MHDLIFFVQDYEKACDAFLDGFKIDPGSAEIENALRYVTYYPWLQFLYTLSFTCDGINTHFLNNFFLTEKTASEAPAVKILLNKKKRSYLQRPQKQQGENSRL